VLRSIAAFNPEDVKITFKKTGFVKRRGSGPITAEFHIVKAVGKDADGKNIYEELYTPSKTRFHTSSVRNSYEKARQYAIHNYLDTNKIIKDSTFYNQIIAAYEGRKEEVKEGEEAKPLPTFCRERDEIEKLVV
jgi:hypothetical protein